MANRREWKFKYQASSLKDASQKRKQYHEKRLKYWTKEVERAEQELREHGIDFRDFHVSGGNRLEAIIDPGLMRRYQESKRKLDKHKERIREYDRFVRTFTRHSTEEYELDIDDMEFFGL